MITYQNALVELKLNRHLHFPLSDMWNVMYLSLTKQAKITIIHFKKSFQK